jgi:hypothetical protein
VILINKRTDGGLQVDLEITGGAYAHGRAWGFGGSSAAITERRGVDRVEGGALSYRVPALTAIHLVLE